MFLNEDDEYCLRSRGTDIIKSPEMLNIGFQIRKEDDRYDRRKKIGTSRASDIWSLGCLFYELLTGKYLFEEHVDDYFSFNDKLNRLGINELITKNKEIELNSNFYLIDFLKYMLVRHTNMRPNIKCVISRFENIYSILVGGARKVSNLPEDSYKTNISKEDAFDSCLSLLLDVEINNSHSRSKTQTELVENPRIIKVIPSLMKITNDIYLCNIEVAERECDNIAKLGITHIISWTKTRNKSLSENFLYLNLLENHEEDSNKPIFYHIQKTMDFLRHCMIYRGVALFLDDYQYTTKTKPDYFIRQIILLSISFLLQLSAYDSWTYINSKILFFKVKKELFLNLSQWIINQTILVNIVVSYPSVRCLCGACALVFKRNINSIKNYKQCNCNKKNFEFSECPTDGCHYYISDIRVFYVILTFVE